MTDSKKKRREMAVLSAEPDVLRQLARDPDPLVRKFVARNRYAPADVLELLLDDPVVAVMTTAIFEARKAVYEETDLRGLITKKVAEQVPETGTDAPLMKAVQDASFFRLEPLQQQALLQASDLEAEELMGLLARYASCRERSCLLAPIPIVPPPQQQERGSECVPSSRETRPEGKTEQRLERS